MKEKSKFNKIRFLKRFTFSLLFLSLCSPATVGTIIQIEKMNNISSQSEIKTDSTKEQDVAIRSTELIEIDQANFNKEIELQNVHVGNGIETSLEDVEMNINISLDYDGVSINVTDDSGNSSFLMMIPSEITSQEDIMRFMAQGVNANNLDYYYPGKNNEWFALLPGQTFSMLLIPNGGKIKEPIIFNFKLNADMAKEYESCINNDTDKRDLFWKQKGDHYNVLYKKYQIKKDYSFSEELNKDNFALETYNSKCFFGSYFQKNINNIPFYFVHGDVQSATNTSKNIITNTKIINTVQQQTLFQTQQLDYDSTNMFFIKYQDLESYGEKVETYVKDTYGTIIPDSWTWKTNSLWNVYMFEANGGDPEDLINAVQNSTSDQVEVKMKNEPIPIIANAYQKAGVSNSSTKMVFYVNDSSGTKQISSFDQWDSTNTNLSLESANWVLPNSTPSANQTYYGFEYDFFFHQPYYYETEDRVNAELSQNVSNVLFDEDDLNNYLANMSYTFLNSGHRRSDYQNISSLLSIQMTVNGQIKEQFITVSEILLIVFIVLMLLLLIGIILLFVYRNKKETESILINPNYKEEANEIRVDS